MLTHQGLQPGHHVGRQEHKLLDVDLFAAECAARDAVYDQGRRGGKALESLAPEGLRLSQILLLQPDDVVAEVTGGWEIEVVAVAEGFVKVESLFEDQRR